MQGTLTTCPARLPRTATDLRCPRRPLFPSPQRLILYVLALRMQWRREVPFRVRRQDHVGHVTMVNLNGSGTIRLVYLQLINQWDQLHPLTASEALHDASVASNG